MIDITSTEWQAAAEIISVLRTAGYEALLAGGCVRDHLLGTTPKDYDVATSAPPAQVRKLFPRSKMVGAQFGVVIVHRRGAHIEVATFRSDGTYSDGRRPDSVRYGTLLEDAHRRDFTINGMFMDPDGVRIIDHVGGQADLKAGIVRTIGDPNLRFAEDQLRLIRAVRIAARLSFEIVGHTRDAIIQLSSRLRTVSAERISQELERILTHGRRGLGWNWLIRLGLRAHLAPSWTADAGIDRVIGERLSALPETPCSTSLAFAAVLADLSPAQAQTICIELRLSNSLTRSIKRLISNLPLAAITSPSDLAGVKKLMAGPGWDELLSLAQAEIQAKALPVAAFESLVQRSKSVTPDRVAPPPLLTGQTLQSLGLRPGPAFKRILDAAYAAQLNEEITTPEAALEFARDLMRNE